MERLWSLAVARDGPALSRSPNRTPGDGARKSHRASADGAHGLCPDLNAVFFAGSSPVAPVYETAPNRTVSPGERSLFVKARELLSNEIALARGVEPAKANAWIDEQLTRAG
jgi:hypothetical protein